MAEVDKMQIVIDVDAKSGLVTIDSVEKGLKKVGDEASASETKVRGLNQTLGELATGAAIVAGLKSIVDASVELQGIMSRLSVGTKDAAGEFAFISEISNRLGLNLRETAGAYSSLTAAARGTALEGKGARDLFDGLSTAAAALKMNTEQVGGALTAFQQMISKGKVSAEELNGQLGERMPGALNIAARSMGVTTSELMKMMQNGELLAVDLLPKMAAEMKKTFSDQATQSANTAQAAFNRLNNAIFEIQTKLGESGIVDALANLAKGATAFIDGGIKPMIWFVQSAGVTLGEFAAKAGLVAEFMSSPSAWFDDKKKADFDRRLKSYADTAEQMRMELAAKMAMPAVVSDVADNTGARESGSSEPTAAQKKQIERTQRMWDTLGEQAAMATATDAERVSWKLAFDLQKMDEQYQAALDAGAKRDELDAQYAQAKVDREAIAQAEISAIQEKAEKDRIAKLTGFAKMAALIKRAEYAQSLDILVQMSAAVSGNNRAMFELNKVASIASITVKGYEAAQKAYAEGGPWLGPVLAAASVAFTAAQIAAVNSTQFGGGGVVGTSVPSVAGGITSPNNTVPTPNAQTQQQQTQQPVTVQIYNQGNVLSNDFIMSTVIPQIQDAVNNSDVLLIDARSRQASVITGA